MIININNITKKYDERTVIDNVSFNVNEGEIVGLIGENGAGKTTIMKMLVNLIKINSGEILFDGVNIEDEFENYISQVGASIETPTFYPYMSGKENLECVGRLYEKDNNQVIEELIDILDVKKYIDRRVSKYSLGMKQRLGVCRAFIGNPKFVILDEPTNGMDVSGIIEFRRAIKEIVEKYKMSMLISSHNLNEIKEICDRILLVKDGKIEEIFLNNKDKISTRYEVEAENKK